MMKEKELQNMLNDIRQSLAALYGERLERLILYGSCARGQADEGSDVDIMVVLDDYRDVGEELKRMSEAGAELSLKYDMTISFFPVREFDYRTRNTPLLLNVRREGVRI